MAPSNVHHVLLGSGMGLIPDSTPDQLCDLLKHLQTLSTTIYGIDTAAAYPRYNARVSERLLGEVGIGETEFVLDPKSSRSNLAPKKMDVTRMVGA
jgi:hypothetical protein